MPYKLSYGGEQRIAVKAHVCTWCGESILPQETYLYWRTSEIVGWNRPRDTWVSKMHLSCHGAATIALGSGEEYVPHTHVRGSQERRSGPLPIQPPSTPALPAYTVIVTRSKRLQPPPPSTTCKEILVCRVHALNSSAAQAIATRQSREFDEARYNTDNSAFAERPKGMHYNVQTVFMGHPTLIRPIIHETEEN